MSCDESEHTSLDRGMLRVIYGIAALIAVGGVAFFIVAWVAQHGVGGAVVTLLWFVLGIPAALLLLHWIGSIGD